MAKKSGRAAASPPIDTQYGHLQPQALDVERLVLGALMIDKDAFSVISETLVPEAFYEPRHRLIFEAIRHLGVNNNPIDIVTVVDSLGRLGTLEEAGGPTYVLELSSRVVSSAHIAYHAAILMQKSLARQLISYASNIETKAFDATVDVNELMQEAEGALFELSQRNMKQDYTDIKPVLRQATEILQAASKSSSGMTGVPSGFTKLDDLTAGWQKSDLIIIAGRPAMGKTTFALSIAKNVAADFGIPIAFFSLEMTNVQLVNRLISNTGTITGKNIQNGQLSDDEWARFDQAVRALEDAPIYLDETPGLSVFELSTKARRLVRDHGVKLILIDYLQLMNANGARYSNRQEEVSTISRSLKELAKDLNIPIIALSQLNRGVDNREGYEGKRPQLSDLRESGAIEQDADMVIFVHRPEYYRIYNDEKGNDLHGKAQIIVAKHRKGGIDDVLLDFHGQYTRFANPSDSKQIVVSSSSEGEVVSSRINADDYGFLPATGNESNDLD